MIIDVIDKVIEIAAWFRPRRFYAELMTEAGEIVIIGRREGRHMGNNMWEFWWSDLGVSFPADVILYAGLFTEPKGGAPLGIRPIKNPNPQTLPGDSIFLHWEIKQ